MAETELYKNDRSKQNYITTVILSAQCTDKRVNMITPALYHDFPTPEALTASSPEVIFEYIRSVLIRTKPNTLVGMAQMLVKISIVSARYAGRINQTARCGTGRPAHSIRRI